jgi:hypothetical protein
MPTNPNKAIISEIRGKLGPWIYSRNPQGPIRFPTREVTPMGSPAQNAHRAIYAVVMLRWAANLTEEQRCAWMQFTLNYPKTDQLGQVYTPPGVARHIGLNSISYKYAGTFLDDPPPDLHCHQPTLVQILTATAAPQALSIRMSGTLDPDEYWVLSATPQVSVGRYYLNGIFRAIDFGADALPHTVDALAAYTAAIGALVAGKKFAVRFQIANVATGTISTPISATATVT